MRFISALAATALAASAHAADAAPAWHAVWAAPPAPAGAPYTWTLNNQTIVQTVRLSAGASHLRLRLSNEYGATALQVGHARVELLAVDGRLVPGSGREVTFGGAADATIPSQAPLLSDPIALDAKPLSQLRVSLYLPGQSVCTCHPAGLQDAVFSPQGDFVGRPFTPVKTIQSRAYLTAVEAETTATIGIVTLGDSITDGYQASDNADRRWPDRLAERLIASGRPAAIANAGLSGNRVLSDGLLTFFGQSALARFDRDVLGLPGVTHLIVLEGVNDLSAKPMPSARDITAGYRQLTARAHAHKVNIILATLTPAKGAAGYSDAVEVERGKINAWIRTQHEADGVIDFDASLRDPMEPLKLRPDLQSGDWLHPNDAGYRAMGDAVDLALFSSRKPSR